MTANYTRNHRHIYVKLQHKATSTWAYCDYFAIYFKCQPNFPYCHWGCCINIKKTCTFLTVNWSCSHDVHTLRGFDIEPWTVTMGDSWDDDQPCEFTNSDVTAQVPLNNNNQYFILSRNFNRPLYLFRSSWSYSKLAYQDWFSWESTWNFLTKIPKFLSRQKQWVSCVDTLVSLSCTWSMLPWFRWTSIELHRWRFRHIFSNYVVNIFIRCFEECAKFSNNTECSLRKQRFASRRGIVDYTAPAYMCINHPCLSTLRIDCRERQFDDFEGWLVFSWGRKKTLTHRLVAEKLCVFYDGCVFVWLVGSSLFVQ